MRATTEPDLQTASMVGPSFNPKISLEVRPKNLTVDLGQIDIIQRCAANDSNAQITWYKDGELIQSGMLK